MKTYNYHYYRKGKNALKYEKVKASTYTEAKKIAQSLHPGTVVIMDTPDDTK